MCLEELILVTPRENTSERRKKCVRKMILEMRKHYLNEITSVHGRQEDVECLVHSGKLEISMTTIEMLGQRCEVVKVLSKASRS